MDTPDTIAIKLGIFQTVGTVRLVIVIPRSICSAVLYVGRTKHALVSWSAATKIDINSVFFSNGWVFNCLIGCIYKSTRIRLFTTAQYNVLVYNHEARTPERCALSFECLFYCLSKSTKEILIKTMSISVTILCSSIAGPHIVWIEKISPSFVKLKQCKEKSLELEKMFFKFIWCSVIASISHSFSIVLWHPTTWY